VEGILYGPVHGTELMECEFTFIESSLQMKPAPNMVFDIDIFLYRPQYGLRIEDGVIVTQTGGEEMSGFRRKIIIL